MVRELTVSIDAKLEKEMSECPEVDWAEVIRNAMKKIHKLPRNLRGVHCSNRKSTGAREMRSYPIRK